MNGEAHPTPESGFTIIEVMVAMLILLVGVLGTVSLIESGLASTSKTTAREQGTNLARDLVERSRQINYDDMSIGRAPGMLHDALPDSDAASDVTGSPPNSMFTVTRRGVTYTVNVFACSIDDPTDGAGQGNATFCAAPTGPPGPTPVPPAPAAAVNVLGVQVDLGGSLLSTVCGALGKPAVLTRLTAMVNSAVPGNSVPLDICPAGPNGTVPIDAQADDLRRVRIAVSWTQNGGGNVSQTTLLTNPRLN